MSIRTRNKCRHQSSDVALTRRGFLGKREHQGDFMFVPRFSAVVKLLLLVAVAQATDRSLADAPPPRLKKGPVLKHEEIPLCLAFSADGKMLATGGFRGGPDCPVRLWDPATGKELRKFTDHKGSVTFVAFSPDGKHLACNRVLNCLEVWDLNKNTAREL